MASRAFMWKSSSTHSQPTNSTILPVRRILYILAVLCLLAIIPYALVSLLHTANQTGIHAFMQHMRSTSTHTYIQGIMSHSNPSSSSWSQDDTIRKLLFAALDPSSSSVDYNKHLTSLTSKQRKQLIGQAGWIFIHTLAANYDPATPSHKDAVLQLIHAIEILYPCDYCRTHFSQFIKDHPIDNHVTSSPETLLAWTCKAHNEVNARAHKQLVNCDDTDTLMKMYSDCGCNG